MTTRPPVSATVREYVTGQFARAQLGPIIDARRALTPQAATQMAGERSLRRREAVRASTGRVLDRDGSFPIAGTCFGRHFHIIEALEQGKLDRSRPVRILQGGAGLLRYKSMENGISGISEVAASLGLGPYGMSYETVELSLLAGPGGKVDVIESDLRVLGSMHETLRHMAVDLSQPFLNNASRLDAVQIRAGDQEMLACFRKWDEYFRSFVDRTAIEAISLEVPGENRATVQMGIKWTVDPLLRTGVRAINGDLAITPFVSTYDLAWLANVYMYLEEEVWWSILVRAIDSLHLDEADPERGGLLMTNRFDNRDAYYSTTPIANRLEEFLTLAGMTLVAHYESPIQHSPGMLLARRTHQSEWLDEQIAQLGTLGIIV